jgi:hypothetical protein
VLAESPEQALELVGGLHGPPVTEVEADGLVMLCEMPLTDSP